MHAFILFIHFLKVFKPSHRFINNSKIVFEKLFLIKNKELKDDSYILSIDFLHNVRMKFQNLTNRLFLVLSALVYFYNDFLYYIILNDFILFISFKNFLFIFFN
jgi:hypothetical protein